MQLPVACTLDAAGRLERFDEWRDFHRDVVVERDRVTAERLRLRLDPRIGDAAVRAIDLARREKACCGFFEFSLVILAEETWLEVAVPATASAILDGFANISG